MSGYSQTWKPDSGLHIVNQGAKLGKELGADCIVSVGGGSAIDTAKGIAILLKEGGKLQDYAGFQVLTRPQTPHIVIPTTAGTGSEVTYVAVIKDHAGGEEAALRGLQYPSQCGILDPKMTEGLPPGLTAATGMDAMCHAIEALHSLQREPMADGTGSPRHKTYQRVSSQGCGKWERYDSKGTNAHCSQHGRGCIL